MSLSHSDPILKIPTQSDLSAVHQETENNLSIIYSGPVFGFGHGRVAVSELILTSAHC